MSDGFRLVTEHTAETEFDYHEWVVDRDAGFVHRDRIGRKNGGTYRWEFLCCNDMDCAGQAMYRSVLIEELAAAWEADRTGSWTLDPAAVQS